MVLGLIYLDTNEILKRIIMNYGVNMKTYRFILEEHKTEYIVEAKNKKEALKCILDRSLFKESYMIKNLKRVNYGN